MKYLAEVTNQIQPLTEEKDGKKSFYITGPFLQSEVPNRNNRIYPRSVMENAVSKYITEKVQNKSAYGELGHPCFTDSAEVLTSSGWKNIKDVTTDDKVFTYNLTTNKMEVSDVLETHENDFNGELINISNRGINTTVTPYHKFVSVYKYKNSNLVTAEEIEQGILNKDSKLAHSSIQKIAEYESSAPETFKIGHREIKADLFCAFMGIWLAEGSVKKRKERENSYSVSLCQNKGEKSEKIQKLLNRMTEETGIKWSVSEKIRETGVVHLTWGTCSRSLGKYLLQFGNCYTKYVPEEILTQADSKLAKTLIEWFILGDGRGKLDTKYEKSDMFSTSEKLINGLSLLAIKAGYSIKTRTEICNKDYMFQGRVIKAENKKPLHFLQLLKSKGVAIDSRFLKTKRIPYSGKVYCITTNNKTFLAKDNGYSFWSGNCGPKINEDRIAILVNELTWNGDYVHGKAKVFDSPMGSIVKSIIEGGGNLGVSSRGLGSLKPNKDNVNIVQNDFFLATAADIVTDPSSQAAWVNGIMENVEWLYDEKNGEYFMRKIDETKKSLKKMSMSQIEETKMSLFESFVNSIGKYK